MCYESYSKDTLHRDEEEYKNFKDKNSFEYYREILENQKYGENKPINKVNKSNSYLHDLSKNNTESEENNDVENSTLVIQLMENSNRYQIVWQFSEEYQDDTSLCDEWMRFEMKISNCSQNYILLYSIGG